MSEKKKALLDLIVGASQLALLPGLGLHETARIKVVARTSVGSLDELYKSIFAAIAQPRQGMLHLDVITLGTNQNTGLVGVHRVGRIRVCVWNQRPGTQLFDLLQDTRSVPITIERVPLRETSGSSSSAQDGSFSVQLVLGDTLANQDGKPFPPFLYMGPFSGSYPLYTEARIVSSLGEKLGNALLQFVKSIRTVALGADPSNSSRVTHTLHSDGSRFVLRTLVATNSRMAISLGSSHLLLHANNGRRKRQERGLLLCLNYGHSAVIQKHLSVLVPVLVERKVALVAADGLLASQLKEAATHLMWLRATDNDDAWPNLIEAPQTRSIAWDVLIGELLEHQMMCPALSNLSLFSDTPALSATTGYTLHQAAASLIPANPGLGSGSDVLYPGLPDKKPRFGGGDGE